MSLLKHRGMHSGLGRQNSKNKVVCPRCIKSFEGTGGAPGLLKYYRNLCKNSNCYIHRIGSTDKKKISSPYRNKFVNCNKKTESWGKLRETGCCDLFSVIEFEDEEKNTDDIDPQLYSKVETIITEVDTQITFEDVAGHGFLKDVINRTIIWPLRKPEIFKGLRSAPKGVLLFGPPGAGKTFIGQAIAFETKSTFFNISSSFLTSKWMGESEKLVRTMFIVAKARQPSVIFIDEVDSVLSRRTSTESGSSRRMKNELLIFMSDNYVTPEEKIMVIGATTKPQELDEAARCRFFKRIYVPLPDEKGRKELLVKLLQHECHSLQEIDINEIVNKTEGYSMSDLKNLSHEAAMGAIKSICTTAIIRFQPGKIRPISKEDFLFALQLIKPSVSKEEVRAYENWNSLYGYGSGIETH